MHLLEDTVAQTGLLSIYILFLHSLHSQRHCGFVAHVDHRFLPCPGHAVCDDFAPPSEPHRADPSRECILSPSRVYLCLVVHVKHQHGRAEHQQ